MRNYFSLLAFIFIGFISCEEEPSIYETLDFIETELDGHTIKFGNKYKTEIQDVSFKIISYEDCECEYAYTFHYEGERSFREVQTFNLLNSSGISTDYGYEIIIGLTNNDNRRTILPIESEVHPYEETMIDKVMLNVEKNQNESLTKALELAKKHCNDKIKKDYFN